jgi:hypothetical protein
MRLQGSFYPKQHRVPLLPIDQNKVGVKELTHPSHGVRSRPRRDVCRKTSDELGIVHSKLVGIGLQGSPRSGI